MRKESIWLWRTKMKIGMCEEVDLTGVSRILEMQNREPNDHMIEPATLSILENHEDVNSLKAQVKERLILVEQSCTTMAPSLLENTQSKNTDFDMAVNSEITSNVDNNLTEDVVISSELNGSDTKICNGTGPMDNANDVHSLDANKVNCKESNMTGDQSLQCHYSTGCHVSDTTISGGVDHPPKTQNRTVDNGTCLTTDLQVHETQGVPVNLSSSDNSRLSRVLENIPFVYIPKTKQLGLMGETNDLSTKQDFRIGLDQNTSGSSTACKDNNVDNVSANGHKTYRHSENDIINDEHVDCNLSKGDTTSTDFQKLTLTGPDNKTGNGKVDKIDSTSFSSVSSISTGTEVSLSAASVPDESSDCKNALVDEEDSDFMEINLHSRNSYEPTRSQIEEDEFDDKGARPKKKSLSGFLSRNLFSRKPKEVNNSNESAPGWKLFGRIPPKETEKKDVSQVREEYQAKQRTNSSESLGRKKQDIEVLSTTALILENRPMNLPSKCPAEEQRHRLEYEAMVEAAKKKELKELRLKKKQLQQQLKLEDQRVACAKFWTNEVLPNWENMHTTKKTRELWWKGLPPSVRGKVWKLAIGNDLNITSELYEICLSRAKDKMNLFDIEPGDPNGPSDTSSEPPSNRETSVELIKLDVARTFPQLCIFQKGGPYYELLHSLLGAYACYRPDVGYVQGMSFIAAVLLLNMDVAEAFICFTNLLNKPCQVAFFRMDENLMKCYFQTFTEFFKENMPKLHTHFVQLSLTPEVYIIDWMFTLFSKSLPLDVACRVWDVFCRDGEEFLFRTALGLLKMHEDILLRMDFIHLAQFMTKIPEVISGERLFKSIDWVKMNIDKKRFIQVLLTFREATCKDS